MSSNYEWQNQYAQQRIRDARQTADAHRAAKAGRAERGPGLWAAIAQAFSRLRPRRKATVAGGTTSTETAAS